MPASDAIVGGCLCGAVRFTTHAPTLFCCHCHCNWCRRAHGAAFVTWFGVRADACRLEGDALRWYASSSESDRGFCTTCGTTMFFRSKAAPGELHIALACADGPIDRTPDLHIFWDAHVPWVTLGDDLKKIDRHHRTLAGYGSVPERPATK